MPQFPFLIVYVHMQTVLYPSIVKVDEGRINCVEFQMEMLGHKSIPFFAHVDTEETTNKQAWRYVKW